MQIENGQASAREFTSETEWSQLQLFQRGGQILPILDRAINSVVGIVGRPAFYD